MITACACRVSTGHTLASTFPPFFAKWRQHTILRASPITAGAACRARAFVFATTPYKVPQGPRTRSAAARGLECPRLPCVDQWGYACRLEIWDIFNRTAHEAGGPACLWVGMIGGTISGAAAEFRDYREICRRAELIMLDNQRRSDNTGFQANAQTGKLVHGCSVGTSLLRRASRSIRLRAQLSASPRDLSRKSGYGRSKPSPVAYSRGGIT